MLDGSNGAGISGRQRAEVANHVCDLIAVAHPNLHLVGHAGKEFVVADKAAMCPAIFTGWNIFDLSTQCVAYQLHVAAEAIAVPVSEKMPHRNGRGALFR